MDSQTESSNASRFDGALLAAALLLLGGAMFAFYYFADQFNVLIRMLGLLAGAGAALALAYQTVLGKTVWSYISGSRMELRKVVWPSRQEAVQATLMIGVVVLIAALMFWGLDAVLLWGVKTLTGR